MKNLLRFFTLVVFILAVLYWLRSDFWRIEQVTCHQNGETCSADIWNSLMSRTVGKNLIFISRQKLCQQIKQVYPEFFEIEIKKCLPDKLDFEIEIRKPVVAINWKEESYCLVDPEGVFLREVSQRPDFPLVSVKEEPDFGADQKIASEALLKVIQILYQAELRLLEPRSSRLNNGEGVEVKFKDVPQALFSLRKEIKTQLDSLQLILERTKIEGKQLERIDLRFDKPVIVEENGR